jgi:hypothetical protein
VRASFAAALFQEPRKDERHDREHHPEKKDSVEGVRERLQEVGVHGGGEVLRLLRAENGACTPLSS